MSIAEPAKRTRRDRCPGVLALHEAADGWLARVRVPGGRLSALQLRAIAAAAEELGSGLIDVTARANLQLRGLGEESGTVLARRLSVAGLLPSPAHDRARNLLASPLAGRSRGALDAVDAVVDLLDARLCATPSLSELPGRFCFLVDDGSGAGWDARPDVAVAACGGGRFAILLDEQPADFEGDASAAVALAVQVALAFLEVRGDDYAWRLPEVPDGARAVADRLGIGLGDRHRPRSPYVPAPGLEPQRDGRLALTVLPPLGRLSPALLRELARLCDCAGTDARLSTSRTVTLVDLEADAAEEISAAVRRAGLELDDARARQPAEVVG